ncbi:uncharacterized protein LOC135406895 isoform X4 [Pseudopipra pipra]|uniref:uncharacterized protein LOC135406895 isoform X4 n=1 Tax=Pseudopipra pipra TaxID=415032 RepID=UPI00313891A7
MGQERGSYLVMLAPPVPAAAAAAACPPAAASRRRHLLLLLLPVGSGAANLIQAPQQQRQQQEPPAEPRRCCLALVRVSHSPAPGSERVSTRVRKSSIQKSQPLSESSWRLWTSSASLMGSAGCECRFKTQKTYLDSKCILHGKKIPLNFKDSSGQLRLESWKYFLISEEENGIH